MGVNASSKTSTSLGLVNLSDWPFFWQLDEESVISLRVIYFKRTRQLQRDTNINDITKMMRISLSL